MDDVKYVDEMKEVLKKAGGTLLLLDGTNSDSGKNTRPAAFDGNISHIQRLRLA